MDHVNESNYLNAYKQCYEKNTLAFYVVNVLKDINNHAYEFSFSYVNEVFAQLEKKSVRELLNSKNYDILENTAINWLTFYGRVAVTGKPDSIPIYIPKIDTYMQIHCYQISQGYCGCTVTDIPKRSGSQDNLAAQYFYKMAVTSAKLVAWEYDITNRRIILPTEAHFRKALERYQLSAEILKAGVIENVPDSLQDWLFHEEDRNTYNQIFKEMDAGKPYVSADIWIKPGHTLPGTAYYERVTYTTICNDQGQPIKAYGLGQDITAWKLESEQYHQTMQVMLNNDSQFMFVSHINLSQNTCRDGYGSFLKMLRGPSAGYDERLTDMANLLVVPEERHNFLHRFERKHLMEKYYKGKTRFNMICRCHVSRSRTCWIHLYLSMVYNPAIGDLEAIMYALDCNEEQVSKSVLHRFTTTEFDYVILINSQKKTQECIHIRDGLGVLMPKHGHSNTLWVLATSKEAFNPDEEVLLQQQTQHHVVLDKLAQSNVYTFIYKIHDQNGIERNKQIKYYYLDKTRQEILLVRTDITIALQQENTQVKTLQQRSAELLQIAMDVDERSRSSKVQLLSQVYHDFWGPVRSLYDDIMKGKSNIDDPWYIAHCLEKMERTCKYLSMLTQKLMDMMSIETGGIEIGREKFEMEALLQHIKIFVLPQARSLSLEFQIDMHDNVNDYYIGDPQRIQQVLIQLISNALKFTPPGGQVSVFIQEELQENKERFLKFLVKDNGAGMSETGLNDPFYSSQQSPKNSFNIQEKWIGLFTVYNLVHLMGGTIDMVSEPGAGTTVTFCIPVVAASDNVDLQKI